ncbi:MAG: creatininase family protein [Candidatus Hodarchaeota archaeon]
MVGMSIWAEMSSPEIKKLVKKCKVAIFPIGSTEQHGPHLPTGTDHIIGWEIAKRVAEKTGALLLPILPIGFSEDHYPRAGTLTLSADTLRTVIKDVIKSLARHMIPNIILLSGHAGHLYQLSDVCYELNVSGELGKTQVHNISPYNVIPIETLAQILEEEVFVHAEELETSLILYLRPDLVDMKKAVKEIPPFVPKGLTTPNFLEAIRVFTTSKFLGRDLKYGVCGDATLATKEKGERLLELMVNTVSDTIIKIIG